MWLLIHFVLVCELYHALSWCEMCAWVINSLSTWPLHLTNDSTESCQSQTASCFSTHDFREVCIYKTLARGFPISCINGGGIQSEGDERQKGKRRGSVKPTVSQRWGLIWWDSAAEVCVYTVILTWSAAQPTETGGWKSRPSSCQWKKRTKYPKSSKQRKEQKCHVLCYYYSGLCAGTGEQKSMSCLF